ncbi:hypothetical protein K439DRAFT_1624460 [Ramaria rubella]|nr:hypothetical protein K439DRAFT_1624460 [Ramaria rubella]
MLMFQPWKFRLGTILYLFARYSSLLATLLIIYVDTGNFSSIKTYIQGLLFARAYAISSNHKLVLWVLALLGTTTIALSTALTVSNNCVVVSNTLALYVTTSSAEYPLIQGRSKMLALFSETEVITCVSVTTLQPIFTIIFDTAVFVVILKNTLGLLQLQSGISRLQGKTLTKLLVQQGILRYGFVLTITLADVVTEKVLRSTLQGILTYFQNSLSVIIVCRFHLDLQQRNYHPNGTNSSHTLPLGSFHAVTERIHRAVVYEFGDLSFNESFATEASQQDFELQTIQSANGVAEINLQEFPWAGGIGDEAGPVFTGSDMLRE